MISPTYDEIQEMWDACLAARVGDKHMEVIDALIRRYPLVYLQEAEEE